MHIVFIGSFAGGGFLAGYLFANNKLAKRFEKNSRDNLEGEER